jgi:structural maintenance of chromosome 3 (chondroitin sulfate proteoglycan 6)
MMSKITYDKKYEKAFEQVFGKTIICPTLIIAAQYARSHGCNAITPEGDTTNKKGAMTGGYIDPRKSRLQAVKAVNKWRDEFETLRARALEIRRDVERMDQEITGARSELQKMEQKIRQWDDGFDPLNHELRTKNSHLEKKNDQLDSNIRRREVVENLLKEYGDSISGFEAELASDFKKALSANEERQLDQLNTTLQDLQKQWNEVSKSRRELESRKQLLEVDLRENLRLKLDNLNSQAIDNTATNSSGNLKESQRELKRVVKQAAEIESKLQDSENQIEEAETKISALNREKAHREEQQQEIARAIEKHQKKMEKSIQKKALITQSAAECAKNIRDLGVLPEEAFERFANTDSNKVCSSSLL